MFGFKPDMIGPFKVMAAPLYQARPSLSSGPVDLSESGKTSVGDPKGPPIGQHAQVCQLVIHVAPNYSSWMDAFSRWIGIKA
jgi:hypothetical protein